MKYQGEAVRYFDVEGFVRKVFEEVEHAKRIESIANAALGVIASGSLIIHRIGRGLAGAGNLLEKHAIKQVDRLLSNKKLELERNEKAWVRFLVGSRKEVKITLDWTEYDLDGQATVCLNMVTSHGRASPLIWKTVEKKELKGQRNGYEDEVLKRLYEAIPEGVKVTILADRGFSDIKLLEFLEKELKFDYCIRIRGNIVVINEKGEKKAAMEWVGKRGQTKTLKNVKITQQGYEVKTAAMKHAKGMKEPWCIVSSKTDISGSGIILWYAKRWGCEPQFRDTKDIHFGMGLYATKIRNIKRRDRILFISAIASVLLTLLGSAGEAIGYDKYLKANTVKRRTLSLFRQGCIIFGRIPRMVEATARKLLTEFARLVSESQEITEILGVI